MRRQWDQCWQGGRDCWPWLGPVNNSGYGYLGKRLAHRRMYEERVGQIPEGMTLDHLCRNRKCVNPAHLEPVTMQENIRRAAFNTSKVFCPRGHPYSGYNLILRQGSRSCRECANISRKRYPQYGRAHA